MGNIVNLPASGLHSWSKAWHIFIFSRMLPSGRISDITQDRAILNYVIHNNMSIDVVQLIYNKTTFCSSQAPDQPQLEGLATQLNLWALCKSRCTDASIKREHLFEVATHLITPHEHGTQRKTT